MAEHFIEYCECGIVLNQCRCPSTNKTRRTRVGPCRCKKLAPVQPDPTPKAAAGVASIPHDTIRLMREAAARRIREQRPAQGADFDVLALAEEVERLRADIKMLASDDRGYRQLNELRAAAGHWNTLEQDVPRG